jgi:hypothetical protein
MDGLVKELLRLEDAKHKALVSIDASAYDENVRKQMLLLSSSKTVQTAPADLDRLLALSQLITLNTRLLQNLVSTTPWFAFSENSYTAKGSVTAHTRGKVSLEA